MLLDDIRLNFVTYLLAQYTERLRSAQSLKDFVLRRPIVIPPAIQSFSDCINSICAKPEVLHTAETQLSLYNQIGALDRSKDILLRFSSPEYSLNDIYEHFEQALGSDGSKLLAYLSKKGLLNTETYTKISSQYTHALWRMISELNTSGTMTAQMLDLFLAIAPKYQDVLHINSAIFLLGKVHNLSNQWLAIIKKSSTPFSLIFSNVSLITQVSQFRTDYLTDVEKMKDPESILRGIVILIQSNLLSSELAEHLLSSNDPDGVARAIDVAHDHSIPIDIDLLKKSNEPSSYMYRLVVLKSNDRLNSMTLDFLKHFNNSFAAYNVLHHLDDKLLTAENLARLKTKDINWLASFNKAITTFKQEQRDFADQFELIFASKDPANTADCTTDLVKYGLWNSHTKKIIECAPDNEQRKLTTAISFLSASSVLSDNIYEAIEENLAKNNSQPKRP